MDGRVAAVKAQTLRRKMLGPTVDPDVAAAKNHV